jgi:hypothetical protein
MTSIVRGNHEQSCRDAEPNQRDERITEPRAVGVNRGSVGDQLADPIVCRPILVENDLPFPLERRNSLTRGARPMLHGRFERPYKLSTEIAWLHGTARLRPRLSRTLESALDGLPLDGIHRAEMIEALRDAPSLALAGTPVKLFVGAGRRDLISTSIRIVNIVKEVLQFWRERHARHFPTSTLRQLRRTARPPWLREQRPPPPRLRRVRRSFANAEIGVRFRDSEPSQAHTSRAVPDR